MSQVFPAHWDVLPFSLAVKDATSEYSKLQKSEYLEQGRFPIVDQGQQKFGGYTDDESVVSLDGCPAIVFGDHTRIFKFIDEPFCLGADGAKVLEPKAELDKKFLFYYLSSLNIESAGYSRHFKFLKENVVPVPPLPEQKRIAAILDKADAIRRKRQQAIRLADDFLRAVFLDMFGDPVTNPKGWPVDKFGNVFDVRDGTHDSPSYVSSGFPLITSKNIKNGEIDMLDVNYISKEDYELINRRSKVDVGDILMPMIGTIGNPAIVRDEPLFAIKNVALIKLGRSSLPAEFVLALLNGPLLEAAVQQKSRGGTQKFLGLGDIRDLNCYLPDERLVSKYIGIANKVRQFASAYRKADEAGLEGSLSQKAFSGQL